MEIVAELKKGFEDFKAKQSQATEDIKALMKEQENGTKESIKAAVEKAELTAKEVQSLADRLVEAEQKLVAGIKSGKEAPRSLGALVLESDEYKAFAAGKTSKIRIETKQGITVQANTISGQGGSPVENQDTLVPAQRVPGIVPGAFRQLRVRDLIPGGNTSSNMIEFTRELAFTNNAAETAEGGSKPESSLTFELATAPVRTIAHWIKVTKQVISDAPALMSYIDTRLRYGVELRVDQQLMSGNGTGQNLIGMNISPNMTAFTPTSGDSALDTINRQKYALLSADYAATGLILNPTDWGNIERSKVGASDDRYVIGDPRSAMGPFLWGLPVVVSNSQTAGKLTIAAFNIAFQVWQREGVIVEMTDSNDTDFQKNLITIRAEERLALAGYRPASVKYGSLTV